MRHLPLVHKTRCFQWLLKLFIHKAPTTQTIVDVHIDYTPRCQDRFLVRIAERVEYTGNTFNALLYGELVGSTSHGTDALTCFTKYIRLIEAFEFGKDGFSYILGHELCPRSVVHKVGKVVDGYLFVFVFQLSTEYQQRHTDRNTTQDRDGIFTLVMPILQFVQPGLLFRSALTFRFLFKSFFFRILLVCKTLLVNINITRLGHGLGLSDDAF